MKKLILIIVLVISTICSFAGNVPVQKAQKVAETFAGSHVTLYLTDSAFYVWNFDNGFVIISTEDNAEPIQGYSFDDNFVIDSAFLKNTGISDVLEQKRKEIKFIKQNHIQGNQKIKDKWNAYGAGVNLPTSIVTQVGSLCQTTWNQSTYYQTLCPQGTYAGCVAIAEAQIMKYWNYPAKGVGNHSYQDAPYGTLSANFSNATYNWANMPNNLTAPNNDVATLIHDIGVAVEMQYGSQGSGAAVYDWNHSWPSAQSSFNDTFGYGFNYSHTVKCIAPGVNCQPSCNPYITWYSDMPTYIAILQNEINNGRPILYAGGDIEAHCWDVDGYEAGGYFHMNFGWGGYDNGYYLLTNINASPYDFTGSQYGLIGIQPSTPSVCKPDYQVQAIPCPAGYSGKEIQTRYFLCPSNIWTAWTDSINTCTLNPIPTGPVINKVSRDSVYFTVITATSYSRFKDRKVNTDGTFGKWVNTGNQTLSSPYFLSNIPCCGNHLQLQLFCYDIKGNVIGTSNAYNFTSQK